MRSTALTLKLRPIRFGRALLPPSLFLLLCLALLLPSSTGATQVRHGSAPMAHLLHTFQLSAVLPH